MMVMVMVMAPSGVRRRRTCTRTDSDRRANRECDQGFSHHATPLLRFDENRLPAFDEVPDAQPTAYSAVAPQYAAGIGIRQR